MQSILFLHRYGRQHDETAPKVYWLNGHWELGEMNIAHIVSERLDTQQMLRLRAEKSRSQFFLLSVRIEKYKSKYSRYHACSIQRERWSAIRGVVATDPDVVQLPCRRRRQMCCH